VPPRDLFRINSEIPRERREVGPVVSAVGDGDPEEPRIGRSLRRFVRCASHASHDRLAIDYAVVEGQIERAGAGNRVDEAATALRRQPRADLDCRPIRFGVRRLGELHEDGIFRDVMHFEVHGRHVCIGRRRHAK
jgi:hypothetical protein